MQQFWSSIMDTSKRAKKKTKKTKNSDLYKTCEQDVPPTPPPKQKKKKTPVSTPSGSDDIVAKFIEQVTATGVNGLVTEFAELKPYAAPDYVFEACRTNPEKNRYRDVVCLDANRVVLKLNVPPESDYIHANVVKMDGLDRTYIATQGPLDTTINDFWRMIYQESPSSIMMLTKYVEDGKNKCSAYFPNTGETKICGPCTVINKKTDNGPTPFHMIEVLLEGCSNSVVVKLIQMLDWPDRGVPEKTTCIQRLIKAIPPGVCVIHCSAGIGRTGTVILVDTIVSRLSKGMKTDVKELFRQLRNQRASAIQTVAQYVFLHICVVEHFSQKMKKYNAVATKLHEDFKNAGIV